jgi:hypothetical protein
MRKVLTRLAARADVTGDNATFSFASNILPASRPGQSLVGVEFRLRSATADVADFTRVRAYSDGVLFYDQTVLHERCLQERYLKTNRSPLTTSGATSTTVIDGGGFTVWFNDMRAAQRELRDRMSAPHGEISFELVTAATGPAAATTVDLVGIYSDAPVAAFCYRTSAVINIANGVTNGIRQIDTPYPIIAYGIPYASATLADAVTRWQTYLKNVLIFDGDLGSAAATEADDSPVYDTGSIVTTPGTGVVIWKDTAGYALPGGAGSYFQVDTGANAAASLATVEAPIWGAMPLRA